MGRRPKIQNSIFLCLLLLLLSSEISAFGQARIQDKQQQSNWNSAAQAKKGCRSGHLRLKNSSSKKTSEASSTDLNLHYHNCGFVEFGTVQKIPYRDLSPHSDSSPLDVNFKSACMRCGICIAVVDRINQSLEDAHEIIEPRRFLDQTEIEHFLMAVCDHGFRHYSLQEIEGERYIGDSEGVPEATPVTSTADGNWESVLKSKCHDILEDAGTQRVYKYWRDWWRNEEGAKHLVDVLCRSPDSGRLRDCQNIDGSSMKTTSAAEDSCYRAFDLRARVKLTAQLCPN